MSAVACIVPIPVTAPATSPATSPAEIAAPPRRIRKQAWLALHFSEWSLYAAMHALTQEQRLNLANQPVVVLDQDRQRRVLAGNPAALAQGVRPGHTLNAALALCAQLQLLSRSAAAEVSLLADLAAWAQRYTPVVSIEAPNELLLEVRGSLCLFGGVSALLAQVQRALHERQLVACMALSPTARASLCLARAQRSRRSIDNPAVVTPRQLKTTLSSLPLASLQWPLEVQLCLSRFGVTKLGELWRLPRADLARRIGMQHVRELDAMLGHRTELRQPFTRRLPYNDRVLLDFEITATGLLEQVLLVRLRRLQTYLREHDLAIGRLHIELLHREHEVTRLCIGLATPTSEMQRVAALLHEQLSRLALPAPVLELKLRVKRLLAAQGIARDLLADVTQSRSASSQTEKLGGLLERLQVRLGMNAVRSLQLQADHRPEYAHITKPASWDANVANVTPCALLPMRPLWLLPKPLAVGTGTKLPQHIRLIQGPERIEAGWWQDVPVRRDYYVAKYMNEHGTVAWCWLFKDWSQAAWYIHGWFA